MYDFGLNDGGLLRTQCLVGGKWIDADDGATLAVANPATGDEIARVASMGAEETRTAIAAAHSAMEAWKCVPAKQRAGVLRTWFDLIMANQEDLARIMTLEQGKPLAESRGEVAYGASYIEWFAEQAKRIDGDVIPGPGPDRRIVCIKQPIGVVAAITPWNFPSAMIARKAAPALSAGCSIVIKPASETPLSALALAELAQRAGLPAGLINVVVGKSSSIGPELTGNPLIRKLTFTGSTAVGKQLEAECAATLKKTSMELGGNAPFIVFEDADLDAAIDGALKSKFRNSGQTCVCSNRFLVESSISDHFTEKLVSAVKLLRMGNGLDEDSQLGPLVNRQAVADVNNLLKESIAAGAKVELEGGPDSMGECYFSPAVLSGVSPDMAVFRNEIFGPIAAITSFDTEDEAVRLANDSEFGLASYLYTRDIGRVWRVSEALEYGMVGINEGIISNEMAPFGGVKESGSGREGSKYGIDDYLEIKYLLVGGLST